MLAILASTVFDVARLTTAELALAAGKAVAKPVVIVDGGDEKLRAAKFSWDGPVSFADEARGYFAFRPTTQEEGKAGWLGFARGWPVWLVAAPRVAAFNPAGPFGGGGFNRTRRGIVIPPVAPAKGPTADRGGLQTGEDAVTTGGEVAVGPASAFAGGKLNWFLQTVPVDVYVEKSPSAELRSAVLTALGADADGEPRWNEFRTRYVTALNDAVRSAQAQPRGAGANLAQSLQIKASFIQTLREADLQKAFAAPGTTITVDAASGSPIYRAGWAMLRQAPAWAASGNPRRDRTELREIDPRQPVRMTFTSPNTFNLTFFTQNGQVPYPLL